MGNNIRLRTKFAVLVAVLVLVASAGYMAWTTHTQNTQMIGELREKGQVLSGQMAATWKFMSDNQDKLLAAPAYNAKGDYQGLHCAVVGRSIGLIFSRETDYVTRFVNFNPRNSGDVPDPYESEALEAFKADASLGEYYSIADYNGENVFRYCAPMKIEENCLFCHGEPKGEIDSTGYPKEGWKIGDNAGAISIVIPLDIYQRGAQERVTQNILFFMGLVAVFVAIFVFAISRLVSQPLGIIQQGVKRVKRGDLGLQLAPTQSSKEMNALITEFNGMAHELETMYDSLESQVEDRTAQLAQANDVLEKQRSQLEAVNERLTKDNQYKSDFLAMMSHELRTPLTSIIAFTELLGKEADLAADDSRAAEACSYIESNSRALLLMINDILEMSRLDAGKTVLNEEVVDMGDLAGMVADTIGPFAERNGIALSLDVAPDVPLVMADFDKLRHVLENLAGNAVKFTPSGGHVDIKIDVDGEPGTVCMRVRDDGIGIAPADHERIFERFVQADSSASRKFSGTGLGLALAKEYVEMHGGTLGVESALGKGSEFVARIPVKSVGGKDEGGANDA